MSKLKFSFLIVLFMLVNLTSAFSAGISAEEKNKIVEQKVNVFEMKRRLQEQNRYIIELTKEMNNVEVNLGMQNKKYLKLADERAKIEEMLNLAKKNADFDALSLKKNYDETKKVLMGILLNKLEKTESASDMLSRKILIENLQRRMSDLDGMIKSNKDLTSHVDELYARLQSSVQTEKELLALMGDLEQKKKNIRESILDESKKKEEAQNHFDEMKNKMAMEKDSIVKRQKRIDLTPVQVTEEIKIPSHADSPVYAQAEYIAPINDNLGIEYQKKGVTFKFQGKNEVMATKGGRIAYTGSLANYGNVIMIDHGNETRSVILGQFDISVKNGDMVKASQIIGYTNPRSVNGLGDGKIYFEVRKNNLAQNTILLLDKKQLTRKL